MKIIFRQFLLFCFILVIGHVHADNITVQGEISGQWVYDTVFIAGDVTVPTGEYVMIHPGVLVVFQGVFEFRVEGAVRAIGAPDDLIRFTMADTVGFSIDTVPGGGWEGIRLDNILPENDSSIFNHCLFEFGKVVDTSAEAGSGGAVFVNGWNMVRISQCTFSNCFARFNGGAIYLDSANIAIDHCSFNKNRAGLAVSPWGYGGAICSDHSSPEIWWNVFEENTSTGVGGGLAVRFTDCNVYNNIFSGNSSGLGGGLGVLHITDILHRINNNLVVNNSAVYFGGGVASLDASPYYINNTIAHNDAIYGGGFYCKDSVSPDFYNTIIWGNTAAVGPQGYLFEVYSQADFFNCDVQGGPAEFGGSGGGEAFFGAYDSCIDEDPLFQGLAPHPYILYGDSPCVDAGSADTTGFFLPLMDLAYNPRIWPSVIDMGAYEFFVERTVEAGHTGDITIYPNPTTGKFKVQSSEFKVELNSVEVYSLSGQLLETWNLEPGTWNLEFDISELPVGIYFIGYLVMIR
jgi:hypothetical protein